MNKKTAASKAEVETLGRLLSMYAPGGLSPNDMNHHRSWGLLAQGVHITRENASAYRKELKVLHTTTCADDFDRTGLEARIVEVFSDHLIAGKSVSSTEVEQFIVDLKSEATHSYLVMRDLRGAMLKDLSAPLELGPYSIYHFPTHKPMVVPSGIDSSMIIDDSKIEYVVGVKVTAKNNKRAIEKADDLFEMFERIVRYMIGPSDAYDVKVMSMHGRYSLNAYVVVDGATPAGNFGWKGSFQSLPLDDPYFQHPELGHDLLWGSVSNSNGSELVKRALMAVQWLGQSYEDKTPSAAFIKAAIALEVLFTVQQRTIINASILSTIAESVAALLGHDQDSRMAVEAKMKKHYATRSAVAHAGKTDVDEDDLSEFILMARRAVMKLLGTKSLHCLASTEELYYKLKRLKYSFPPIA